MHISEREQASSASCSGGNALKEEMRQNSTMTQSSVESEAPLMKDAYLAMENYNIIFRCMFVGFLSIFLLLPCEIGAQLQENDECTLNTGGSGRCKLLEQCQPVYQDLLAGKSPDTLCGFSGFDPIVCCSSTTNSGISSSSTTKEANIPSRPTTTPFTKVTTADKISSRNLAEQKCAEYASFVYGLVEPPTLTVWRKPVNVSLCAVKSKRLIVGGKKADPKEFPHMAAVGFVSKSSPNDKVWLCGGTLVSDNFVMTAAHCTHSLEYGNAAWVRVGDLNLLRTNDDAKIQERRIIERIRNPAYRKPSEYHDIALLRLEFPVVFDAYVRPACLPSSTYIENEEVIATGWGRVDWADADGSDDLLKVTLPIVPHEGCNERFIGDAVDYKLKRGIINNWQICAGNEGHDTCQGDSGGPIVAFNQDHDCMYDVVGITSLGKLCGSSVPGIYTRVYNYIRWLENTIWH